MMRIHLNLNKIKRDQINYSQLFYLYNLLGKKRISEKIITKKTGNFTL